MKIIIIGGGKVGLTLAEHLSTEDHEVTVIDKNQLKEKLKTSIGSAIDAANSNAQEVINNKINEFNNDNSVHGILVQLPLPKHLNETKILNTIKPEKDVDGFTTINAGLLFSGQEPYSIPCTPAGICKLLDEYHINTSGKNVVVLGRSNIVGKPIAFLLSQKPYNATVTICHSATENLTDILKNADIIIAAIGKPEFITASSIKEGVIIVDVGINRVEDKTKEKGYRLCGDVNFQDCYDKCKFITPVPGGVGLMTVACLIENTYKACLKTNQV